MRPTRQKFGTGTILILVALLGLLGLAGYFLYSGWGAPEGGTPMSAAGWVAMALGIAATLALGVGLMALMYYSNRHGRD